MIQSTHHVSQKLLLTKKNSCNGLAIDLNPIIENVCYIMKNNVEKQMPRNVDELKRFMVEEFLRKQSKILLCL